MWTTPVAILPFTGTQVAGSLLLASPFELMNEPLHEEPDLDALVDWSRELANLLMGSVKTALLRQGIILELGVPTSVIGNNVRIASRAEDVVGLVFERDGHALLVALDAYLAANVEIRDEASREPTFDVLFF